MTYGVVLYVSVVFFVFLLLIFPVYSYDGLYLLPPSPPSDPLICTHVFLTLIARSSVSRDFAEFLTPYAFHLFD